MPCDPLAGPRTRSHTRPTVPYGSAMKPPAHPRWVPSMGGLLAAPLLVLVLGCGGPEAGQDPSTESGGAGEGAQEPGVTTPGGDQEAVATSEQKGQPEQAPPPRRTREELEAALQAPPADLPVVEDESFREEGDPAGFPAAAQVGGVAVRIVRERSPDNGGLLRIFTALADAEGDSGRPILHGPEWTYFESGAQSGLSWWKEDVLHGPVKQWRPVGTLKFERLYVDGQRDGLSRAFSKAGKLLSEEIFDSGQRDGPLREWFASGERKEEAEYVQGKRQGARKLFTRTGVLMRSENYEDGELHGRWSDFHGDSGVPKTYGSFERGQRVGVWEEATPEGKVVASREFAAGVPHGQTRIWTPQGTLIEEVVYVEGRKTGPARTWYSEGTPQSEGRFEDGARQGRWVYWRKDETLNDGWSGLYEDDVRTAPLPADDPSR